MIQTAFKGYITRLLRPDYHIHAYFQFVTCFFLMGKTKMDAGNICLQKKSVSIFVVLPGGLFVCFKVLQCLIYCLCKSQLNYIAD